MLTITEPAGEKLAQLLSQQGAADDVGVRVVYEGQGLVLQADRERDGDTVVKHQGRTVLLLDVQVSELLADDTLDLVNAKLTLQRPEEEQ